MISNKATFSAIELASIFGDSKLINFIEDQSVCGIVTDTRIIEKGNIFIALIGEKFNGHDLVSQAFEKGASACVIEIKYSENILQNFPEKSFIITDNNLDALGKIANYHRRRFNFPVLGIAGSNGKTTTKEMAAAVLAKKYKVLKTFGNFNNKIGLPLMLLQFSEDYNFAVLEVGTNTPGEIYDLSKVSEPTDALITNIGKEHLEFLIDLDGVELEETYIFSAVRSGGHAFVNYDDERLKNYGHILSKFTTYGEHEHATIKCSYELNTKLNPRITVFKQDKTSYSFDMQTVGYASALNAIAAIAVGTHFDVKDSEIAEALSDFKPLEGESGYGRMAIFSKNNITIINDTYNSNPDSMKAALKNIEMFKSDGLKIAALGDMRELGESAFEEHQNTLKNALEVCDLIFVTGNEMSKAAEILKSDKIKVYEDKQTLSNAIAASLKQNDCLLVKGSRGMQMEQIVNNLKEIL
ncbi:MAG: UDP-N-acetylmuramoyl-tripeptide--D-alanyl-D-alanine ligase [Candidatus Kapabacteria bacterium]|nr:UDP-N-acetylmuramoyl-tripeptide--D-alanyl-D-alanine ligase [Ignavibacteriota bacterium]MCW5885839.1 UDP-N-acetylmuramoyl-tripeptide--D-alanyl-D-alanine ligase [Candidatus Kapabacteria bacterium]